MRLIDADALQRRICGAKCGCEYEDCGCEGDCGYDHFIFHAPTIDAVPVVRCKDCIGKTCWYKNDYDCTICGLSGMYVKGDTDFCSYGERRSDG